MKLYNVMAFTLIGVAAMFACPCCSGSKTSLAFAADVPTKQENVIERDYLVKGMTCDGCIFGVKKALGRAGLSKDQIIDVDYKKPDPEHKIGHAKVKFPKDQYKGQETDCKIVKEIKGNPGYIAYWDPTNTDPCGLEKKN